jgi:hypothetical protein
MTFMGSCKLQGRNVLEFTTRTMNANLSKNPTPALVPAGVG